MEFLRYSIRGIFSLNQRRIIGTWKTIFYLDLLKAKQQPCKTKLFYSELEFLGHKISKGRVGMIPEYVQKIKDWPVLKSGKEVATFLGFAGYYHRQTD